MPDEHPVDPVRILQQATTFMAVVAGAHHRIQFANGSFRQLFGGTDVTGKNVVDILPRGIGAAVVQVLDTVRQTGTPFHATGVRLPTGIAAAAFGERLIDIACQPMVGEDGSVDAILVEGVDVSGWIEAKRSVDKNEQLYRGLFDAIDEGFCIIEFFDGPHGPDSDYIHIMANDAYERHAGIANVVGQKLREMVGEEADAWVARYREVLNSGRPIRFQQELVATGRYLELAAVRIEPRERKQVAVLFQDITARRNAELELARLNATLEQQVHERTAELMASEENLRHAQKMEAVGQLTGGLAHDFNNILGGIAGSLELMSRRLSQGRYEDIAKYVEASTAATRRAAALTQRLLAFSRRQTLEPKPVVLSSLVEGMADLVARTAGPHITVSQTSSPDLWQTHVDPGQLENALLNLCINARDAMPAGGTLSIETANRDIGADDAAALALQPGEYVALSVADTGTGMSEETVRRAFDPFFTTKPAGQGTGLGLSMVYGLAGQSGGGVSITSRLGAGTTITILLPRHIGFSTSETGSSRTASSESAASLKSETILLVDDDDLLRTLIAERLTELGYGVVEAPDARLALASLGARTIDLLVTDVGLPGGMNGRQLAESVRDRIPRLGVLFITGYAENAVLNHLHLDDATGLLVKPFSLDTLADRIGEMLRLKAVR
ncbi:response regulator [Aliihoeflea aestuarii]|uniref:response regulator n=1 Tax=Aliihoeflea aestuarii TaxID=453840 RepID=UPI0020928648|nr:response regulator [Aliihoeflea aestuarii]